MERVYFTFGSWEKYPYPNGYIIVEAENHVAAIAEFRKKYPDLTENCLNCADWYRESEWTGRVSQYYSGRQPSEILQTEVAREFYRMKVLLENAMKIAIEASAMDVCEEKGWLLEAMGTDEDELKRFGIEIGGGDERQGRS